MASQEFLTKRDEAFELLFEVIELARKTENHDELDKLKHWLLGDAGKLLVIALTEAGKEVDDGIKCLPISPLYAYIEKCKEQAT